MKGQRELADTESDMNTHAFPHTDAVYYNRALHANTQ